MMEFLKLNEDTLVYCRNDKWHISNPRMRTHVEICENTFKTFSLLCKKKTNVKDLSHQLSECNAYDCTDRFIGRKGLVNDHSGYRNGTSSEARHGGDIVELLIKRHILINPADNGLEYAKKLTNLFDQKNLGSFHQRVGQFIMMEKRTKEPWREWQNQKFTNDGKSLLDTSYKKIQEPFFNNFFNKDKVDGKKILDFGCGNGYYTSKLSANGAIVTGLDNSVELLDLAVSNYKNQENLIFRKTDTFDDVIKLLDNWGEGSIDYILLQDTILLLINPEDSSEAPNLSKLLKAFRRILGEHGKLFAMEPNPQFWLSLRMGNIEKPYTVLTEYNSSVFNVAPTLDVLLSYMSKGGFALENLEHPKPVDSNDEQYKYQIEFPVWDFYTFRTF